MHGRVVFLVVAVGVPCACVAGESSLTIYGRGFAVVRDSLQLQLEEGVNEIRFDDITTQVEPRSVMLLPREESATWFVLEQNYASKATSLSSLLKQYEGETIKFQVAKPVGSAGIGLLEGRIIRAGRCQDDGNAADRMQTLLWGDGSEFMTATDAFPIVEIDGSICFGLPGRPLFPTMDCNLLLRPTLSWLIHSDSHQSSLASVVYITEGLGWRADYDVIAAADSDVFSITGRASIENTSGHTFDDVRIALYAGKAQYTVSTALPNFSESESFAGLSTGGAGIVLGKADEAPVYSLKRSTTLRDGETKSSKFIEAEGVRGVRLYKYEGATLSESDEWGSGKWKTEQYRTDHQYGTESRTSVEMSLDISNTKANRLGLSIPKGIVRFYRLGDDGQLEFVGDDTIKPAALGDTIEVSLGEAYGLTGDRVRTDFDLDKDEKSLREAFTITLRNRRAERVEVCVIEKLYRRASWTISDASLAFEKTGDDRIRFVVPVEPGEESVVAYSVHYTW